MRRIAGFVTATLIAAALAITSNPAAAAGPKTLWVTYDETEFLTTRRLAVTETFDHPRTFFRNQRIVSYAGLKLRSLDPAPPWWAVGPAGSGSCPQDCALGRGFRYLGPFGDDLGMSMHVPSDWDEFVYSLGFRLIASHPENRFVVRVIEDDGKVTPVRLPADIGEIYVGLHSSMGIKKVVIVQRADLSGGRLANFKIDDLSRSHFNCGTCGSPDWD